MVSVVFSSGLDRTTQTLLTERAKIAGWLSQVIKLDGIIRLPQDVALVVNSGAAKLDANRISAPLVTIVDDAAEGACRMDGFHVAATSAAFDAMFRDWAPIELPVAIKRMRALFGRARTDELLASLHARLTAAALEPSADTFSKGAHGLAGFAGLLGFATVAATLEAVAQGDESEILAARIAIRVALAAIDRSGN